MSKSRSTETEMKVGCRADSSDRTVHLLPPVLGAGAALPPIVGPRERVGAANKSAKTFMKRAMGQSGKIPGKGVVDGRRRRP